MELWEQIAERIELPKPEQKVFIWGAGNTSVLNHQGLQRENLYNELGITAFLDSKLAGGSIFGYPVYHPDILDNSVSDHIFVYISTTNYRVRRELEELCKQKNIKNAFLDASILKFRRNEYKKLLICSIIIPELFTNQCWQIEPKQLNQAKNCFPARAILAFLNSVGAVQKMWFWTAGLTWAIVPSDIYGEWSNSRNTSQLSLTNQTTKHYSNVLKD